MRKLNEAIVRYYDEKSLLIQKNEVPLQYQKCRY